MKCDYCKKCVQLMSAGRVYCERYPGKKICRMQSSDCSEFDPIVYYDTDSCDIRNPYDNIACTILWKGGETTYIKGRNALRIARAWLYSDEECLMVYTAGWIYLKAGDPIVT